MQPPIGAHWFRLTKWKLAPFAADRRGVSRTEMDPRLNMVLFQGGGVSFGPNGVCWDCPLSFPEAAELVAVVVACVAIGTWLRGIGKPRLRTIGGCLLVFAAIEIFVINHAGWNWGIIQSVNPLKHYNRYAVSAFALTLATAAAGLVIYFDRRSQKKQKQSSAG